MEHVIYLVWSEERCEKTGKGWFYFTEDKNHEQLIKIFPDGYVKCFMKFKNNLIIDTDYCEWLIGSKFFKSYGIKALSDFYTENWGFEYVDCNCLELTKKTSVTLSRTETDMEIRYNSISSFLNHVKQELTKALRYRKGIEKECRFFLNILNDIRKTTGGLND